MPQWGIAAAQAHLPNSLQNRYTFSGMEPPVIMIRCKALLFMLCIVGLTSSATIVYRNDSLCIHRINAGSNAYLIETHTSLFLVDAGYPGKHKKIVSLINQLSPKKLKLIFITHGHFDHYGSAAAIKKFMPVPLGIHLYDSAAISNGETPLLHTKNGGFFGKMVLPMANKLYKTPKIDPDIVFLNGDSLHAYGLNATVVHTPGHTAGSCCLLVSGTLLFSGDLINSQFGMSKQKHYALSWSAVDSSLSTVKALAPTITFTGHGAQPVPLELLQKLK